MFNWRINRKEGLLCLKTGFSLVINTGTCSHLYNSSRSWTGRTLLCLVKVDFRTFRQFTDCSKSSQACSSKERIWVCPEVAGEILFPKHLFYNLKNEWLNTNLCTNEKVKLQLVDPLIVQRNVLPLQKGSHY